ncbi:MAG TPA: PLP-dependent aminotransferase family protein [Streptosporangiaceae bacterium]
MVQTRTNLAWETLFDVSAQPSGPLHDRLTRAVRSAIKDGRLPRGAALPPSRTLAADLGVSRWAVTQAYGQLVTEGYLSARTGSATRVIWSPEPDEEDRSARRVLAAREAAPPPPPLFDLRMWGADYRAFPRRKWVDAIRMAAETTPFDHLDYGDLGGEPKLRAVLAEHLNRSRGADADVATVCVYSGARQSLVQLARALIGAGHRRIGVESPGSCGLWDPVQAAGMEVVPLPVDGGGLITGTLAEHSDLRAVCLGTARQILLGAPLAPDRRSALLDWARRVDGIVVEDDYDAEFGYERPVPPVMQGTDRRRVALLGSMSRALTPTINVGWVVPPPNLVDAVRSAVQPAPTPPAMNQLALAHFMESGAYDRHLRASRLRFRTRRNAVLAALERHLPGYPVTATESGLHVLIELPDGTDLTRLEARAARRGVALCDPTDMWNGFPPLPLLPVGYSNLTEASIDEAIALLSELIRASADESPGVAP